jgi:predicted dehydrogenase
MPGRALRVAIVGLNRGAVLHRALALQPGCEVIGVCSARAETARSYAAANGVPRAYATYDELLADRDVDAVVVASPVPHHAGQAIAALGEGKHVLSEVPAAQTLEECAALVEAVAAASGRALYMLGENANYGVVTHAWRELVAQGLLGRIFYAESQYVHDLRHLMRDASGRPTWRAGRAPIQYCTHELGPLLSLLSAGAQDGGKDRCVSAIGQHSGTNVAPELGAIDLEVGLFRTRSGALLKVLCAFAIAREPWGHLRTVYGTRGCLETGRPAAGGSDAGQPFAYLEAMPQLKDMVPLPLGNARRGAPPEALVPGGHGDGEYWMARDFVRALRGEIPVPIDVFDAMDYTVPGICAHRSAENGGVLVEVPDFRQTGAGG